MAIFGVLLGVTELELDFGILQFVTVVELELDKVTIGWTVFTGRPAGDLSNIFGE